MNQSLKPFLLALSCLILSLSAKAQKYVDSTMTYWEVKDTNDVYFDSVRTAREALGIFNMKGTGFGDYQIWLLRHRPYAYPASKTVAQIYAEIKAMMNRYYTQAYQQPAPSGGGGGSLVTPVWSEIGPSALTHMENYYSGGWQNGYLDATANGAGLGVGRVDILYRAPGVSPVWACGGGEGGGIFIGYGNAPSWIPGHTDGIPFSKARSIAKHPTSGHWFIGLAGSGRVYRALNPEAEANAWRPINNNTLPGDPNLGISLEWWTTKTPELEYSSSGRLFAATQNGLYYSDNSGVANHQNITWTRCALPQTGLSPAPLPLADPTAHFPVSNVKTFQKTVGGVLKNYVVATVCARYQAVSAAAGHYKHHYYVFLSDDNGSTWTNITGTGSQATTSVDPIDWGGGYIVMNYISNIECLKEEPNYIYITLPIRPDNGSFRIFKYSLSTGAWLKIENNVNVGGASGQVMSTEARCFGMNPTNENQLFVFINAAARSNDGGATWTTIKSGGQDHRGFHGDVRDIVFTDNGQEILLATDGGVFKYNITGNSYVPVSEGIGLSQPLYQFDVNPRSPYHTGAGFFHSGIQVFNPNTNKWHGWNVGDGSELRFDKFTDKFYGIGFSSYVNIFTSFDSPNSTSSNLNAYGEYNSGALPVQFPAVFPSEVTAGEAYAGSNFLYKKTATATTFSHLPCNVINTELAQDNARLTEFSPVPTDPDMFYMTFEYDGNQHYRIWKVDDVDSPTPQRSVINNCPLPAQPRLEIDRNDPDVFYAITYTTEATGPYAGKKIYKYDHGTWTNLTVYPAEGYPESNFPWYLKTQIIRQDRRTGILYLGTTEGVFYLDEEEEIWKRMGHDLPFGPVSDLRINQCEGYIYAAIWGRGIWKAQLVQTANTSIEITGTSNLWNTPRYLYSDVTVKTGAKLKITSDVFVGGFHKFMVEPGAILEVNGGRITDGCGVPWHEIQLWGNNSQPQTAGVGGFYPQARLILNNATIENSSNGVTTWKPNDWGMTGGLIQANRSTFHNNDRSVEIRAYSHPDKSYFTDCHFLVNGTVAGGPQYPRAMVTAENISGTKFVGCTFERVGTSTATLKGIYTHNARFTVLPGTTSSTYPPPPSTLLPTQFKNLTVGIEALNGTSHNFKVDTALFENCRTGIIASRVNQFEVLRSRFVLDPNVIFCTGISHGEGTGYKIEGNHFSTTVSSGALVPIGIRTDNTGVAQNEVYRNTFVGIGMGDWAQRKNWSPLHPDRGLKYKCNLHTGNTNDFFVNEEATIGRYQGTVTPPVIPNDPPIYNPAGNIFTLSPEPTTGHIYNGGPYGIQYVHHKQSLSAYNVEPTYISTNVTKVEATNGLITFNNFCPSKLPSSDVQVRKANGTTVFASERPAYDNLRYIYRNLLDGGNTQHLLQQVEYAWGQEIWDVRDELLGESPFLTEEVLYSVASNPEIPHAVQLEIFMANPHCAKDADFMEYLATKDDPLPQWMIDLLAGLADVPTLRTELENQMAANLNWAYGGDEVLKAIHEDSTGYPQDSLLLWTRRIGHHESVVDLYSGWKDYASALSLLDTLIVLDTLAGEKTDELEARGGLYTILAGFADDGHPYWLLDVDEQNELLTFAQETDNLPAHREARNILAFYYGYTFEGDLAIPEPKSAAVKPAAATKPSGTISQTLKVYPNPSKGQTIFEYRYPALFVDLYLEVYTQAGASIKKVQLTGGNGVYVWDCSDCPAGGYFYKVASGERILDSGSVQISK